MASEIREKAIVVEEEAPAGMQSSSSFRGSCIAAAEEDKRKSVFIRLRANPDGVRKNLAYHADSYYTTTTRDGDDAYDCNLSPEHRAYGVVYLEKQHELFFIGGYTFPRDFKKEVWIYNFQTESFYPGPPMNRPRFNPTVFAYQNNIYVFGGSHSSPCYPEMNFIPPNHFVEVYDSVAKAWLYQRSEPPEEIIIDLRTSIAAHALDEENGVVYFWTMPHGVYSYHIPSRSWSSFKLQGPPWTFDAYDGARWSNTTIFLHSCVVWSYFGTIYAYRVTDHLFLTLFTLPEPFITEIGSPMDFDSEPAPSYLVNVGYNKLCFVYGNQHNHDSHTLRCHTLEVQYSPVPLEFTLVHKGCHISYCGQDFKIESVHVVNLGDVSMMKKKVLDVSRTLPIECVESSRMGWKESMEKLRMMWEGYPQHLLKKCTPPTESSGNEAFKEEMCIDKFTQIKPSGKFSYSPSLSLLKSFEAEKVCYSVAPPSKKLKSTSLPRPTGMLPGQSEANPKGDEEA